MLYQLSYLAPWEPCSRDEQKAEYITRLGSVPQQPRQGLPTVWAVAIEL